jgi:serine/threonine-protein kinase
MGEVYEAEDTVKERVVALKLLSPALCHDPVFRERLQREARTAGRLQEPHVVPVHDYGEIDGQLYLDMRLIEGTDLSALLRKVGALAPSRAVAIIRQAASALDAAHAAGVIHRDIKPENILITRDDFVYLVDFGIASATADERLTQAGSAVGTWKYAAPEQFTDAEVSYSVDVYALACVLHECLTGSPPYRADNAGALITAHLMEPIPHPSQLRPGIPATFDEVIRRGMAKDAKNRYASASELALAANAALSARDQARAGDIVERSTQLVSGGKGGRGPTHSADRPRGAAPFSPSAADWPGRFGAPPPPLLAHRPTPRKRTRLLIATAVALAAAVGGLVIWLLQPLWHTPRPAIGSTTPSAKTTPAQPDPNTQARLFSVVPPGYQPGTCKPITPPKDALAKVLCGGNSDPGGPPSATYALFSDKAALRAAFDTIVTGSVTADCPGRIQSPGPWHRNATPEETSGMLWCGTQQDDPAVVWTNDAELLISAVRAEPPGSTLEQLYTWWTSHS